MLARLQGWNDVDVLKLLAIFRKHLLYYVYTSDSEFAEVVRTELPEKSAAEILEMTRSLMQQFALRISTKNFRTDVIVVNGQEGVYVYKHIYESISQLAENKVCGIWLPDELSRFLRKARQYRGLFPGNQDVYFKRIQVWSKSIAETTRKFYAFRDIYFKEKKRRLCQRKGVELARFTMLKSIFEGVPASQQMAREIQVHNKAQKLWSPEELSTLVDFIVRITKQIQKTGTSDLVNHVADTLGRTDGSCINKLADMKNKFLRKSATVRAAHLPDVVFDPTSDAYKIFSADWKDVNDPYALGYLAMKTRSVKMMADRNRKRRGKSAWVSRAKPRPLKLKVLETSSSKANPISSSAEDLSTAKPIVKVQSAETSLGSDSRKRERASVSLQSRGEENVPMNDYAEFVQNVVERCQSGKNGAPNLIAKRTPGVEFQKLTADVECVLTQFKQRFGSLDGFENLCLTVRDTCSANTTERQAYDPSHARVDTTQSNPLHRTFHMGTQTCVTTADAQSKNFPDKVSDLRNSNQVIVSDDEGDLDPSHQAPSALEIPQSGNELNDDAGSGSSIPPITENNEHNTNANFSSMSKHGKDEQYGKKFIKKRRLNESFTATSKDNVEDNEDDIEYEAEDDDGCSEDGNNTPSVDCAYPGSDVEHETPHPLQFILDSLESDIAELEEKQRKLIERKEEREWRQHNHVDSTSPCNC